MLHGETNYRGPARPFGYCLPTGCHAAPLAVSMVCAAGTALFLTAATALVVDGSFPAFITRYRTGLNLLYVLTDNYTLREMYWHAALAWTPFDRNVFWSMLAAQAFLAWLTLRVSTIIPGIFITFLAAIMVGIVIADTSLVELQQPEIQGMWLAAVGFGTALGCLLSTWRVFHAELNSRKLAFLLVVLLLPFAYAFGTDNNLWTIAQYSFVFWIVASAWVVGMCRTQSDRMSIFVLLSAGAIGTAALLVGTSVEHPYRQPSSLRVQHTASAFGPGGGTQLKLDEASAKYIWTLRDAATRNDLLPGAPYD